MDESSKKLLTDLRDAIADESAKKLLDELVETMTRYEQAVDRLLALRESLPERFGLRPKPDQDPSTTSDESHLSGHTASAPEWASSEPLQPSFKHRVEGLAVPGERSMPLADWALSLQTPHPLAPTSWGICESNLQSGQLRLCWFAAEAQLIALLTGAYLAIDAVSSALNDGDDASHILVEAPPLPPDTDGLGSRMRRALSASLNDVLVWHDREVLWTGQLRDLVTGLGDFEQSIRRRFWSEIRGDEHPYVGETELAEYLARRFWDSDDDPEILVRCIGEDSMEEFIQFLRASYN